ncbi:MAG: glycoside hydrolase family 97 protein [Bacteroidales bacterium]|nr:glycoside hydrolase family 97 protein [Bacteroidales bacterium]
MTLTKAAAVILLTLNVLASCKAPEKHNSQGEAKSVPQAAGVLSPGGKVTVLFELGPNGEPMWSMKYKSKTVIEPSRLGFELAAANLKDGFQLIAAKTSSKDETWEPVWGETREIRNFYNELEVTLTKGLIIRFRVYDYGVGLRYEFTEPAELTIKEELTEFKLTGDHTAWWIPGDYDSEEYVTQKTRLSEIEARMPEAKQTYWADKTFSPTGVQTPLQLKTDDGLYINIHEAACADFSTMSLELQDGYTFRAHLTPGADGSKGRLTEHTPWRTVKVSDDARDMLSKPLILNLNEPCAIEDVSWIHPIKYVGVWWEMITGAKTWAPGPNHGASTENVKRYIDFAAANGMDEVLVEGWNKGWEHWEDNSLEQVYSFTEPYPDFEIKALNEYAHSKGVKLLMHHETASAITDYERQLPEALKLMNQYGYDAVKTGYCGDIRPRGEHHYSQYMNRHYLNVVKQAAEQKIMVDAHEASRPTGLSRTWPNLIAQESARGGEYEAFAAKGGNPPEHTLILPFTRLQGGPMDYTPGIFETDLSWANGNPCRLRSTIPGQLALYLILPSPLQMAADLPEHYEKHPDAFQFIREVALDWDDSRYLEAEPGEYITVARKAKGTDDWFVGSKTASARETKIKLSFLDKRRPYIATIYKDAPDKEYEIETIEVTYRTKLTIRESQGGGFTMTIKPKQ